MGWNHPVLLFWNQSEIECHGVFSSYVIGYGNIWDINIYYCYIFLFDYSLYHDVVAVLFLMFNFCLKYALPDIRIVTTAC